MEDVTATLNTLIEPACLMLGFVNWYGECLSTAVIHGVNHCDFEFLRMLSQMLSAGHPWSCLEVFHEDAGYY